MYSLKIKNKKLKVKIPNNLRALTTIQYKIKSWKINYDFNFNYTFHFLK